MDAIKQVWPKLPILGIDMSEAYLRHAKRYLRRWSRVNLSAAKGENLPVADGSQDALTSIFLFHELPPSVRRAVLRECARVLKPGGRLVLVDRSNAEIGKTMKSDHFRRAITNLIISAI